MRRFAGYMTVVCAAAILCCGCGSGSSDSNAGRTGSSSAGVKEVLEAGIAQAEQERSGEEDGLNVEESLWEEIPENDAAAGQEGTTDVPAAETAEDAQADTDGARQSGVSDNAPAPESAGSESVVLSTTEGIDVDLTILSSTMVYSQVFNMLSMPEEFIGQTVRMAGAYAPLYDEMTGNHYDACIVKDATACCASGIEFVLTDDYAYPDDYPAEGEEITVTGVFDTYYEDEYMYCTLRDASLE